MAGQTRQDKGFARKQEQEESGMEGRIPDRKGEHGRLVFSQK